MTIEYKVNNTRQFTNFISKEIGTEYEVIKNRFDFGGFVTVYDLTTKEREKINIFILDNKIQ